MFRNIITLLFRKNARDQNRKKYQILFCKYMAPCTGKFCSVAFIWMVTLKILCKDSKARTTLYSKISNSTTGKYYSAASIWMFTCLEADYINQRSFVQFGKWSVNLGVHTPKPQSSRFFRQNSTERRGRLERADTRGRTSHTPLSLQTVLLRPCDINSREIKRNLLSSR